MLEFVSIALIVVGAFFSFIGIVSTFSIKDFIIIGMFVIALGLAQICLGLSMKKLSRIENKLATYIFDGKIEDKVPQQRCVKCDRIYDGDVEECPYCELQKHKKFYIDRME